MPREKFKSHHDEVLRLRSELRDANEKIGELKAELSGQPSAVHEAVKKGWLQEELDAAAAEVEVWSAGMKRKGGGLEKFDEAKGALPDLNDPDPDDHAKDLLEAGQAVVRAAMEWHGNLEDALALNLSDHSLAKACDNLAKVREKP